MENKLVVLIHDEDCEHPEVIPGFTFVLQLEGTEIRMTYSLDFWHSPKVWEKFILSVESGRAGAIVFGAMNGNVTITTKECETKRSMVSFEVAKCGGDGDGKIVVVIPGEKCLDAFRTVVETLEEYKERFFDR